MCNDSSHNIWDTVVTFSNCLFFVPKGEYATQICFQGKFGEELGSDQFGAQIMIHQMEKDTQVIIFINEQNIIYS